MDPDLIRLILAVLGVSLVAGIYLWDRRKRNAPGPYMGRRAMRDEAESFDDDEMDLYVEQDHPSPIDDMPETVPSMSADADVAEDTSMRKKPRSDALDPEPGELGNWSAAGTNGDPQVAMDFTFGAHGDSDYLNVDPALADEVERKIIVLNIIANGANFRGDAIAKACAATQLRLGEMEIFHHHDGATGKVLFSIANMVEPGSFPVDDMGKFSTPGLTLFTQLPGARDGLEVFESMVATGRELASLLQGELQDERRNKLTAQMERHIAESIVEHRRRVALSRSRR